jgi:hypothetical protein
MEKSDPPVPYTVEYSSFVLQHFRLLARQASARGDGPAFTAALREFHRRLELFPQFGDPIIDLSVEKGQIRLGIIRPLSMRYGVYEERRLVLCGALPILLPMARPDTEASV